MRKRQEDGGAPLAVGESIPTGAAYHTSAKVGHLPERHFHVRNRPAASHGSVLSAYFNLREINGSISRILTTGLTYAPNLYAEMYSGKLHSLHVRLR